MSPQPFKAKAYLKDGCPFSFKFLLFMVEAGLSDRIEVIRCKPGDSQFETTKAMLAAALGREATFPTVEIEPGRYESDSETLIRHFAREHEVRVQNMPALAFYKETLFPQVVELHEQKKAGAGS